MTEWNIEFSEIQHCGFEDGIIFICCPSEIEETIEEPDDSDDNPIDDSDGDEEDSEYELQEDPEEEEEPTVKPLEVELRDGETIAESFCNHYNSTAGLYTGNHIRNGVQADSREFPHMAALQYQDKDGLLTWECGGSLISNRYILTAAHCVSRKQPILVRLGTIYLYDKHSEDPVITTLELGIENITQHPNYRNSRNHDDIALIKLNQTVDYGKSNNYIRPACLHTSTEDLDPNIVLWATGWGMTDPISK